jgi:hypothetical protein
VVDELRAGLDRLPGRLDAFMLGLPAPAAPFPTASVDPGGRLRPGRREALPAPLTGPARPEMPARQSRQL